MSAGSRRPPRGGAYLAPSSALFTIAAVDVAVASFLLGPADASLFNPPGNDEDMKSSSTDEDMKSSSTPAPKPRHMVWPLNLRKGAHSPSQSRLVDNHRRRLLDEGGAATLPLHGSVQEHGYYYVDVKLGTPSKTFQVIVDTVGLHSLPGGAILLTWTILAVIT
jgi:hypothetical protein